jgi:hypothetical protein
MKKTPLIIGVSIIAFVGLVLTMTTTSVTAQKDKGPHITIVRPQGNLDALQRMTEKLLDLYAQQEAATNEGQRLALLDQIEALSAARNQMLLQLMRQNPDQVLQVALPSHILDALPVGLQKYFEKQTELDGELEVIFQENETQSELHHYLKTGDQRIELHFRAKSVPDLLTGERLHVRGVQVGEDLVVEGQALGSESTTESDQLVANAVTISSNTFSTQKVLLILVNFQDKAVQPYTVSTAQNILLSTGNYYSEASYGQTSLTGDVTGWYTIPLSSGTCSTSSIATYAKQAAQSAGYNLANYTRFVYAFPEAACSWAGWGTIGGNPSQAWINGTLDTGTLAHELGHNFGLYHSRYLNCGQSVIGSNCTSSEYGDAVDVMGIISKGGHFNAYQKARLGWLGYGVSPPIIDVSGSGTYTVDGYETANGNPKALRILKSVDPKTGTKTWYWIEFRRPVGFDRFVSTNNNLLNGVVFHQQTDGNGTENYLLDMTPGSMMLQFDPALILGQSFTDLNAAITFTPVSVTSTSATVSVSYGAAPCVRANPTLSVSPVSQWAYPGAVMNYQVSITNNDSVGCAPASFNLQSITPNGWSALFDTSTMTLGPTTTGTTTVHVSSPSFSPNGYYNVVITASNADASGYTNSASITCSIMSDLYVAVTTDQAGYSAGQTIFMTATVMANGLPVSSATVAFTITKPNGSQVKGSASTSSNGTAVYKYKLNKQKDPGGIYQVNVGANFNGAVGSATTSFTVR